MGPGVILTIGFAVFAIVLVSKGIFIVKQSECVIVERLGKFSRLMTSGINLLIPIVDATRPMFWANSRGIFRSVRIDMRETVLDVPEQAVITKDNVSIEIDALMYVQIIDPIKAMYEISNLPIAVSQLAQTSLRNVIGEMDLDETLASRDMINTKLKTILDEATDKWGTKVNRVELKNIAPPREIQVAMEKQMQAERERRAQVLEAEGDKQARIARSEGEMKEKINIAEGEAQAAIRSAEGEAKAIELVAEAQKEAITRIKNSVGDDPDLASRYLVATKYIEQFGKFVSKSAGDKVFVPYEASTAIGSIGGMVDILSGNGGGNGGGGNGLMPKKRTNGEQGKMNLPPTRRS